MTHGKDETRGIRRYLVENRKKFFERWRDVLSREHFDPGQELLLASDRSLRRPHMSVINHDIPIPNRDAGLLLFAGLVGDALMRIA